MALFGSVKRSVRKVLEILFSDPDLAKDVVYKKFVSSTFNEVLKRNEDVYTNTGVKAIQTRKVTREGGGQSAQEGDIIFLIRYPDVPVTASLKDQIVFGTEVFSPTGFENIFDLVFVISVEAGSV